MAECASSRATPRLARSRSTSTACTAQSPANLQGVPHRRLLSRLCPLQQLVGCCGGPHRESLAWDRQRPSASASRPAEVASARRRSAAGDGPTIARATAVRRAAAAATSSARKAAASVSALSRKPRSARRSASRACFCATSRTVQSARSAASIRSCSAVRCSSTARFFSRSAPSSARTCRWCTRQLTTEKNAPGVFVETDNWGASLHTSAQKSGLGSWGGKLL